MPGNGALAPAEAGGRDAATVDAARALCEEAARRFDLEMGRVHEKPVGPHPKWSCQLACSGDVFAELLPWLATNRGPLTVFAPTNAAFDKLPEGTVENLVKPENVAMMAAAEQLPR